PVVVVPTKKTWDDEDAEDTEIKESWEDSDDSDSDVDDGSAAPTAPTKKRITVAQKIAEKNAERQKQLEERAQRKAQGLEVEGDAELDEEDIVARRQAERNRELNADAENAADLFSGMTIKDQKFRDDLASLNPRTKDDFDQFRKLLVERITSYQNQRYYSTFVDSFARDICVPMSDMDVRKAASSLSSLANDKQKAARDAAKGKKKTKKPAAKVQAAPAKSTQLDTTDYSNNYDDFDDFM
ncbi:eukaryotic translation initiation factor 3 subunit J, partial [Dimargaris cristalligena]